MANPLFPTPPLDNSGNPLVAGSPTLADAWQYNADAAQNWIAQQRAESVRLGLVDPQTGWPTQAGLVDAARQYASGMLMGTTAPGAKGASFDNPAFAKWFGASKVTAPDGSPLVVYHGTNADVPEFSGVAAGQKTGNVTTTLGHFFTDKPAEASRYAAGWQQEGGNVIPAHLSLQNPYEMSVGEFDKRAMSVFRGEQTPDQAMADNAAFRQSLQKQGYDGVIIRGKGMRPTEYVAFNPTQIKSATGNRGTYDPNDPRIIYGAGLAGGATAATAQSPDE